MLASVHDLKYLNDVQQEFFKCVFIGDKGYLSADIQLNLFETVQIKLEVPYRLNQKDWKPFPQIYGKVRKRIETNFSQVTDQFNIMRNYAKQLAVFFTRIICKISAFTIAQYLNVVNNRTYWMDKICACLIPPTSFVVFQYFVAAHYIVSRQFYISKVNL